MADTECQAEGTEPQVKGRIAGMARASDRLGQVEIPVMINGHAEPVIVHIARWKVAALIAQLKRADRSAQEIKKLRRRGH